MNWGKRKNKNTHYGIIEYRTLWDIIIYYLFIYYYLDVTNELGIPANRRAALHV